MEKILRQIRMYRGKSTLWLVQKITRLWFSRWRNQLILPFMRSGFFAAVFVGAKDARPNFAQIMFQRVLIAALRSPRIMVPLFWRSMRVCVTYRCNLSCKACYARGLQEEVGKSDISMENFTRLAAYCKDKGWRRIRFLGGEPTIHPKFIEMLDLCYKSGIEVSMPTNNLYSEEVAEKFDPRFVRDLAINYSAYCNVDAGKKAVFRRNLNRLREKGIPFSFSYILEEAPNEEQMRALYADLKEYLPLYIRVSIELPAFSDHNATFIPAETRKFLFSRVYSMLENCARAYVPFYMYRPVPLCLFSTDERLKMEKFSKFIFFTRCPLSYASKHGYGMMVTINPDLSTFPCASVFIKGPDIFSFKDRNAIHEFYSSKLQPVLSAPLAEACKECDHHTKFVAAVSRADSMAPAKFDDKQICQGGCVNLRCHDPHPHECHQE